MPSISSSPSWNVTPWSKKLKLCIDGVTSSYILIPRMHLFLPGPFTFDLEGLMRTPPEPCGRLWSAQGHPCSIATAQIDRQHGVVVRGLDESLQPFHNIWDAGSWQAADLLSQQIRPADWGLCLLQKVVASHHHPLHPLDWQWSWLF